MKRIIRWLKVQYEMAVLILYWIVVPIGAFVMMWFEIIKDKKYKICKRCKKEVHRDYIGEHYRFECNGRRDR